MAVDKEPSVKKRTIPVYGNPWKPDLATGHTVVSSGPLPTHDELPPLDGSGKETIVEGSEVETKGSSSFPGEPRDDLPLVQKGAKLG